MSVATKNVQFNTRKSLGQDTETGETDPVTIVTRSITNVSATDAFKDTATLAETLANLAGTGTIAAFVKNVITEFVESNPEVAQEFVDQINNQIGGSSAGVVAVVKETVQQVVEEADVDVTLPPSLYKPA